VQREVKKIFIQHQ